MALIPDTPTSVNLAKSREKYQVSRILQAAHEHTLKQRVDIAVTGQGKTHKPNRHSTIAEDEDVPQDHTTYEDERDLLPRRGKKKVRKASTSQLEGPLAPAFPDSEEDTYREKPRKNKKKHLETGGEYDGPNSRYNKIRAHTHALSAAEYLSQLDRRRKANTTTYQTAAPPVSPLRSLPKLSPKRTLPPLRPTLGPSVPELSYGDDGETFIGNSEEKFPGLRVRHPPTEIVSDDDQPPVPKYGGRNFAYDGELYEDDQA